MDNRNISQIVEAVVKNIASEKEVTMTLDLAKKIAEKVEAKAAEIGVKAVVAISNCGARPVLVE